MTPKCFIITGTARLGKDVPTFELMVIRIVKQRTFDFLNCQGIGT